MISFMFGTLGSVTFWVLYFVISLFVSTAIIKSIAKDTFSFLTGGNNHLTAIPLHLNERDTFHPYVGYTAIAAVVFLFWPAVLVYLMFNFAIPNILLPLLKKMIIGVDKMTPTVKFEKKKADTEGTPESSKEPTESVESELKTLGELETKVLAMLKLHSCICINVPECLLTGFINMVGHHFMYYRLTEREGDTIVVVVSSTKEDLDSCEQNDGEKK